MALNFAGLVQSDKMRTPILARPVEASQLALSARLLKKKANLLTGVAFSELKAGAATARMVAKHVSQIPPSRWL